MAGGANTGASERGLRRSTSLPQAVALYAGAVVGAGVLILPGVAAGRAGPASLVAWSVDGLLGVPVALTFAALAARLPDAGGVSVYAARAFGDGAGAVIGWFYFFAATVAQALVTLTGAHYAADALHWGRGGTFAAAGLTLALAVATNLRGLRLSGRLQLALAATVAATLLTATLAAIPEMDVARLEPFAPHGWHAVGATAVTLFFAFFGWEAVTHLSAEFRDPARDVPRATVISVAFVTVTYLGVAFAVVATGTYGGAALDRVAVAHVLDAALGTGAGGLAAVVALLITLGTANAFVAATSRLGYALGRDGALPAPMAHLSRRAVPTVAIAVVGGIAAAGLVLAYLRGWGAEAFLVVPNSLVIVVYAVGMAAGVRLLHGGARLLALIAVALCFAILPFAGVALVLPLAVASVALLYRLHRQRAVRRRPPQPS
jgi:amino acid efflux transporter